MKARADSIPTRQSLLARLKIPENHEGWQQFFDTYWNLIYSMAIRSGLKDAEAQDVVQETIICVARSMPNFQYDPKIGSFKAWLRKLTRWRILDHLRKRSSAPVPLANLDPDLMRIEDIPDESDAASEAHWDEEWRKAILEAAVEKTKAKVDEKQFQIFDLCALRGWSTERVAATLRITRAQIYVSKHRVGKVFERELKGLDLDAHL